MGDENYLGELTAFADSLGLTPNEQWTLAMIVGRLLYQSWQEGYDHAFSEGWRASASYTHDVALLAQMPAATEH
jgi:hypothetical protein